MMRLNPYNVLLLIPTLIMSIYLRTDRVGLFILILIYNSFHAIELFFSPHTPTRRL